ncbi:metallophosphoesterase [Cohnella phaseoli]|uniref:Putative phosphoesterase n=1 Tax=Cohnella phaseoli TaxID=456490 RepID=A0A3D9HQF5_9BACL|nr:metallophosphoesterase [Cohnella phaseoli]RED51733.1 putative phosphoesterase [Cohnella phaseoli]
MKIGIISDLHVDLNELAGEPSIEEALIEVAGERRLDGLIVAGDISNDANRSLAVLHELKRRCGIPVWFVPGNHDYWSKINGNRDTWSIYRQFQTFEGCLSERPAVLDNGWVILGNSGWYDYTMGEPGYTFDDFERMHAMDRTWQDSLYVTWGMSNRDIHKYFYDSLERELAEHRGKSIVMVTHMLGHPYFKVPMPHPQWSYFNAFLGSTEYAELYRRYGVRYGIMGHVHYRKDYEEQGTKLICSCLGYRKEWRQSSAVAEIRDCLQTIVLED